MTTLLRRCWKYFEAALGDALDRRADPRLQVELAVEEGRRQHQLLTAQAASVLGNERELGIKVSRALAEVERLRGAAGRALVLAARARENGQLSRASDHEETARLFATQLAAAESTAADLGDARERAAAAATAARQAVERSAHLLNTRVAEASRLMTEIEAARMQERVADALGTLDSLAPRDVVPTLAEIRARVDRRIAVASARAEFASNGPGARMLEIERAGLDEVAAEKLKEIRQALGLPAPSSPE